jgi:hypothetical protein
MIEKKSNCDSIDRRLLQRAGARYMYVFNLAAWGRGDGGGIRPAQQSTMGLVRYKSRRVLSYATQYCVARRSFMKVFGET